MAIQHFLQFTDFTAEEHAWIFQRAAVIKRKFKNYEKYHPLADRTLAMIFEKASTRTRVSFEISAVHVERCHGSGSISRTSLAVLPVSVRSSISSTPPPAPG